MFSSHRGRARRKESKMLTPFSEMPDPPRPAADPLGLEAIDQQIRINELRAQTEALGMSESYVNPDSPPEIEEAFLRNVLAYESAPITTHFVQLEQAGVKLTPPEELDDAAITSRLWDVIHALARLSTFLGSMNHLCDRELYTHLWQESLRECTPCLPPGSGWNCHLDLVGSGSDDDNDLYLRYYADEETREHWRADFPKDEIPPHEDPPFDRDRLLPRPGKNG
jgi:hypothetical protein